MASAGLLEEEEEQEEGDGKVATRLGTREKRLFSLLSFVAVMESEMRFSRGLSLASANSWNREREERERDSSYSYAATHARVRTVGLFSLL